MQILQNPTRIFFAVALVVVSLCSLAQGQGINLVFGSDGNLEVEQGVCGTISVFAENTVEDPNIALIVNTATLAVDSDQLAPGEITFDDTDSAFSSVDSSMPPFTQDLSVDFIGAPISVFGGAPEFLGTLRFDTSNLDVGDTFILTFAGSEIRNFTADILTRTSNIQVTVVESVLLGDTNLDGIVSFLDIAPFIATLSAGAFSVQADINCDGLVTFLDIAPFIGILSGQ